MGGPSYKDPEENRYVEEFDNNTIAKFLKAANNTKKGYDEAFATGLRNCQKFFPDLFAKLFGPNHSLGDGLSLLFGFGIIIPYTIATFYEDKTNDLEELLKNLTEEFGQSINLNNHQDRIKLTKAFNQLLDERKLSHYLEARVERKEGKYDLVFYYKNESIFKDIFLCISDIKYNNFEFLDFSKKLFPSAFNPELKDFKSIKNIDEVSNGLLNKLTEAEQAELEKDCAKKITKLSKKLTDEEKKAREANIKFVHLIEKLTQKAQQDENFYKNNLDFCKELLLYEKLYSAFYNNQNCCFVDDTFEQCRIRALQRLNEFSTIANISDFINNYCFLYWICYFIPDLILNQDDTSAWALSIQLVVIGGALAFATGEAALQLANYLQHRFKESDLASPTKTPEAPSQKAAANKAIKNKALVNNSLKHQLLEAYAINFIGEKNLKRATYLVNKVNENELAEGTKEQIQRLLDSEAPKVVRIISEEKWKKLDKATRQKIIKKESALKMEKQFSLLEDEANTEFNKKNSLKRVINIAKPVIGKAIQLSFLAWIVGVILIACTATALATIVLSNPAAIICFGFGMAIGGYYAYKQYKKDRTEEENLQEDLAKNRDKIEQLKRLEIENRKLESLIIAYGKIPLTENKAHQNRSFKLLRFFSNKTDKQADKNKERTIKSLLLTSVGIGTVGTGFLIVRLLIIPAIAIGTGMLFATTIGLYIAIGVALIWGGIHLYNAYKQSKVEQAKETFADIDNRIKIEQDNQATLSNQLGFIKNAGDKDVLSTSLAGDQQENTEVQASKHDISQQQPQCPIQLKFFSADKKNEKIIALIKALGVKIAECEALPDDTIDKRIKLEEIIFAQQELEEKISPSKGIAEFKTSFTSTVDEELYKKVSVLFTDEEDKNIQAAEGSQATKISIA